MKLFIADDEQDVREGIHYLLDWNDLGFSICGEARNGQEALEQIVKLRPDIVLLDIRMPRLSGLEVIKLSKEQGFSGQFIILSGYSDFSYAQQAISYGVINYLTKPIDEKKLEKAVLTARQATMLELSRQKKLLSYRSKAREAILQDILLGSADFPFLDYRELKLEAPVYQAVIYTDYNQDAFQPAWDFAGILRLANRNSDSLDHILIDNQNVILLKGEFALNRFQELLVHYISHPQKNSPLDSLFLCYGRPVYSPEEISLSYLDARHLMDQRFFCHFNQHTLGYSASAIAEKHSGPSEKDPSEMNYSRQLADYLQSGSHEMVQKILRNLEEDLRYSRMQVSAVKHYLADILIQVKSIIQYTCSNLEFLFPGNAVIISTIEEKYYLYEIMQFFSLQMEMCMNVIGPSTKEGVMDGVLEYIRNNYRENLRLNTIADLFGYSSSHLGKLFVQTTGKNFNAYVDEVRIDNSKILLKEHRYKIYEVAQLSGYSSVDYFHRKFKRLTGMSPAEYRKGGTS